ncbi:MAG: UTP--glucose-1-phosphate uridylyltransferase GalU [Proteobacteria bacterium]|nr:UTP--glucose-1-phosphate uridylyltransferase GalU [Pseudomonadota bacterium]
MTKKIRTAVFPVAGLGTRFLPATKSIPKEMLPLVDRPLIQYAIDEARAAGITEFIFVTARGKSALEDYFDRAPALERELEAKGKTDLLAEVRNSTMPSGAIAYIRQQEALGLGHAVWCARRLLGDQPFAVILPDDVIAGDTPCLKQMVDAYDAAGGGCMMAVMDVPASQVSNYGVLKVAEDHGDLVRAAGLVEKPAPEAAPSNVAVIGRYILTTEVLESLGQMKKGAGGEIQLTDAIAEQIGTGIPVHGYRFRGQRYDCGSKAGFLRATVAFALAREDLCEDFAGYIRQLAREDLAVGW